MILFESVEAATSLAGRKSLTQTISSPHTSTGHTFRWPGGILRRAKSSFRFLTFRLPVVRYLSPARQFRRTSGPDNFSRSNPTHPEVLYAFGGPSEPTILKWTVKPDWGIEISPGI